MTCASAWRKCWGSCGWSSSSIASRRSCPAASAAAWPSRRSCGRRRIHTFKRSCHKEHSMPRTRSLKWSELKIGIMAVVAILIAATLILTLSGTAGLWWQRYHLKVRFNNAGGVNQGSIVRVAGLKVGSVTKIDFVGSQIEMTLELRKDNQQRVRTTSVATIGSMSLLGEGAVDITA